MPDSYTLADFEYDLPEDLIAQEPLAVRHESRLMQVSRQKEEISDHKFSDLLSILQRGDVLVVNDTRVLPARIQATRASGGAVEILLLKPEASCPFIWQAMATKLKRLKPGEELFVERQSEDKPDEKIKIVVKEIVTAEDEQKRLLLDLGSRLQVVELLSAAGLAPLPPYIKRGEHDAHRNSDLNRYQTVFAQAPGAVAAPTAGLHFSEELLEKLAGKGIEICRITLHVGPGTFKPITTSVQEHHIEKESFSVSPAAAGLVNKALDEGRRVIAVGTTSCRALETAGASGRLLPVDSAETGLYIRPGFDFKIVKGLITNFHLSKSSLLVLVSAFAGRDLIMRAYREAVAKRYRFFSYGDAMLIL